jgi:hypothetical protein
LMPSGQCRLTERINQICLSHQKGDDQQLSREQWKEKEKDTVWLR